MMVNEECRIEFSLKDGSCDESPYSNFEKIMGVRWVDHLQFTPKIFEKVVKQSKKAMKRKELSIKENWFGVRYRKEITEGYVPKVSIRWIDPLLGYGVFAEEKIFTGAYVGEYTGTIRKRTPRKDRKNDYCFEYTIGDWLYNPFIIDAKEEGNFTRFINHSDTPNLETMSVFANEVMHIIFVAVKPIEKGTQLCYHYGDTFWKKRRHAKRIEN